MSWHSCFSPKCHKLQRSRLLCYSSLHFSKSKREFWLPERSPPPRNSSSLSPLWKRIILPHLVRSLSEASETKLQWSKSLEAYVYTAVHTTGKQKRSMSVTSALKCGLYIWTVKFLLQFVSFLNLATDYVCIYFVCMTVVLSRSSDHYSP
jgi:hypothetical protein